ncbi:MAG: ornithine cyclodeaminase family protein [Acidobacteriota bacterium]
MLGISAARTRTGSGAESAALEAAAQSKVRAERRKVRGRKPAFPLVSNLGLLTLRSLSPLTSDLRPPTSDLRLPASSLPLTSDLRPLTSSSEGKGERSVTCVGSARFVHPAPRAQARGSFSFHTDRTGERFRTAGLEGGTKAGPRLPGVTIRRGGPSILTLIAGHRDVVRLLPMDECIGVMERALAALARGEAVLPLRSILWLPEKWGALGLMPAFLSREKALGVKAVSFFPRNEGTELDSHQGAVLLFESERGRLEAILDATTITAIRTAAVSGAATRLLARRDAGDLALVGSGVQARTHLAAMLCVRTLRRVRVAGQDLPRAREFAKRESRRHGIEVEAFPTVREAVAGADIVCTVTSSAVPVVAGEWLAPGCHVNAIGSSVASARELDTAAVAQSRLWVDRRESALAEAGDFLLAKAEGAVDDRHIVGEVGEALIGTAPGRGSNDERTLFKAVGLAIEDVACARYVLEKASRDPAVLRVDLGGGRDEAD